MEANSGVLQGSVLDPTLWNILYDSLLRMQLPNGVENVSFADEVVLVVSTRGEEELEEYNFSRRKRKSSYS